MIARVAWGMLLAAFCLLLGALVGGAAVVLFA
jgi:hypothetical protein